VAVEGKTFSGLVFGHQLGGTTGQFVRDLELIAKASELDEWVNVVRVYSLQVKGKAGL
jgi:hypothetical protein